MDAALAMAAVIAAQDPAAQAAPAEAPAAETNIGVSVYPPAFFAEYRPQTAQDMLSRVPGFSVNNGGGGRGFGEGGNVLINGSRPSSKSDNINDVLRRIPADSVERIELIRGSAPGIDMQGHAAVANVIRKAGGGELNGALTVRAGVNEDFGISPGVRVELSRSGGDRLFEGSINLDRYTRGGGSTIRERVEPDGDVVIVSERFSGGHSNRYEATGAYEGPLLGGRLRATVVGSQGSGQSKDLDIYTVRSGIVLATPFIDDGESADENESREYGLQYTRDLWGDIEFEGAGLYSENSGGGASRLGVLTFRSQRETTEAIARGALRFPTWKKLTFDASSEVAKNTLSTQSLYLRNGVVQDELVNPALSVEELRSETAVNLRWQARPTLRVEMAARYETSTIETSAAGAGNELAYLKPRLLVSWTPSAKHQFSLRVEKEVSQLSFGDFTASASLQNETTVSGNADIVPDQSTVYEARYQYRSGRTSFLALYTLRDRVDIIDRDILAYPCEPPPSTEVCFTEYSDNVGDGTFRSVGLSATLPTDKVKVAGGLLTLRANWVDSEMIDPITGNSRVISGPPPFSWNVSFSQDVPNTRLKWGFFTGNQSRSVSYRPRELNYRHGDPNFDVFFEYLGEVGTFRIQFENITDRVFVPIREVYGSSANDDHTFPGSPDTRANSALDYTETRYQREGRSVSMSFRKNF